MASPRRPRPSSQKKKGPRGATHPWAVLEFHTHGTKVTKVQCAFRNQTGRESSYKETTWFPTHRRSYGFRSFSATKMSFSLQRNVIFSHVDVKNRVLKISKTTSFFDISSCFFGMQPFFSFFSEALHCFDGLAKFFEKSVRCQCLTIPRSL